MNWYLATNEIDIFHYGSMKEEWQISTGQPKLFFYDNKEELIAILESYGHEYQEPIAMENIALEDITPEPTLPEE